MHNLMQDNLFTDSNNVKVDSMVVKVLDDTNQLGEIIKEADVLDRFSKVKAGLDIET